MAQEITFTKQADGTWQGSFTSTGTRTVLQVVREENAPLFLKISADNGLHNVIYQPPKPAKDQILSIDIAEGALITIVSHSEVTEAYYIASELDYYTKDEIDDKMEQIHQFEPVVASSLPTASADTMYKFYFIPKQSASEQTNTKEEWMTVKEGSTYRWEKIGETDVDLSDYVTVDDLEEYIENSKSFKGWFDSSSALSAAYPSPKVGDYAYIKGATASDPAAIYECATAGTWTDSGRDVDTSNVQTFLTGEQVNSVGIDDEPTSDSDNLIKSRGVYEELNQLDQKVDELELQINGGTIETTDNHGSDEFALNKVFIRSTGNSTESSSFRTTNFIEIPQNCTKIEAKCVNGNPYYAGISFFSTNQDSAFLSGTAQAGLETVNTVVSILNDNIPPTARYIRVMAVKDSLDSYVKLYSEESVEGIIYDGLDSNDATKALSAKQGKVLKQEIDAINNEIDGYDEQTETTHPYSDFNLTNGNVISKTSSPVGNRTTSDNILGIILKLPENIKTIEAKCLKSTYYYGLSFFTGTTSIGSSTFISGHTPSTDGGVVTINEESIPSGAKSVFVSIRTSQTGGYVKFNVEQHIDGLSESIESLGILTDSIEKKFAGAELFAGVSSPQITANTLTDGTELKFLTYPISSKSRGESAAFRANVSVFNKVLIGKSVKESGFGSGYSSWIEIDSTNIVIKKVVTSEPGEGTVAKTIPHGLTIQDVINVIIEGNDDGSVYIKLATVGAEFSTTVSLYGGDGGNVAWLSNNYGSWRAMSVGSTLTDCKLSVSNKYIRKPFWIFGASYESTHDTTAWPMYAFGTGFQDYYINATPGRGSEAAYNDLLRALNLGTPKFLLWTIWGNGTSQELDTYIQYVLNICIEKGITLIIVNRPNSSANSISSAYSAKKAVIDKYINLGVRYWDIAAAVSSNPSSPDGWYSGYLNADDGVHPTALGAKAMALQIFSDIPELMQY